MPDKEAEHEIEFMRRGVQIEEQRQEIARLCGIIESQQELLEDIIKVHPKVMKKVRPELFPKYMTEEWKHFGD